MAILLYGEISKNEIRDTVRKYYPCLAYSEDINHLINIDKSVKLKAFKRMTYRYGSLFYTDNKFKKEMLDILKD